MDPTTNQSQISHVEQVQDFQAPITRRDPNAQTEQATNRPSSRVLSAPGGKSNFSLGQDDSVSGVQPHIRRRDPNARSEENYAKPAVRPSSR